MKRIAILGANGQVGTEVCLLLKLMPGVEVVPICRSETSASYLRRCDLDVRIGRVDDGDTAARLLEKCDAVADFSLPTGSTVEVQRAMRSVIPNLARYSPAGVPLVYLSSITAFGIPDFHHPLREYRISRNSYGACKRYGERLAFRSGRTAGRFTFCALALSTANYRQSPVSSLRTFAIRETRRYFYQTANPIPSSPSLSRKPW